MNNLAGDINNSKRLVNNNPTMPVQPASQPQAVNLQSMPENTTPTQTQQVPQVTQSAQPQVTQPNIQNLNTENPTPQPRAENPEPARTNVNNLTSEQIRQIAEDYARESLINRSGQDFFGERDLDSDGLRFLIGMGIVSVIIYVLIRVL